MREVLSYQVAQLAKDPLIHARYREAMLKKVLTAALAETHMEKGYIQRMDKETGQMVIDAQQGWTRFSWNSAVP